MRASRNRGRTLAVYVTILGTIYIIIGAAEFISGLWHLLQPENAIGFLGLPIDLFGGFSALVIGAAYLGGVLLWKGETESLGFLLIATILSIVFGLLYFLIVCADGFSALIATWEGEEWTWEWLTTGTAGPGILRLEIWLAIVSVPLLYFAVKSAKKRKERVVF